MKKVLSLLLALVFIFSLTSCRGKDTESSAPADTSSLVSKPIPDNTENPPSFDVYDEKRAINNYVYGYVPFALGDKAVDEAYRQGGLSLTSLLDFLGDNDLKQKHILFQSERNKKMEGLKGKELYEYKMNEVPPVYTFIKESGISKEKFKEANTRMRSTFYNKGVEETAWESVYTDEEVDLLFSADVEAVKKALVGKYGFYHNGKVYYVLYLHVTTHEDWIKENLPIESIKEVVYKVASYHTTDLIDRQRITTESSLRNQEWQLKSLYYKLAHYEILLDNQN
jgi:hypothetical protein